MLLILDWEKAFDKVDQEALFEAMERMNIDPKLIRLTKQLDKNRQFYIEMDGNESKWKTKKTGIRQGCTLSPYLFLVLMTVIFADVHSDAELRANLIENRPPGLEFDEVLYADDTIFVSTDGLTTEKTLEEN